MRARYVLGLVLFLALGILWWRPWSHESAPVEGDEAPVPLTESSNATAQTKQKNFFQAPREPLPNATLEPAISPRCRELWADIRKLNLGDSRLFSGDRFDIPNVASCTQLPKNLELMQNTVLEKCNPSAAAISEEKGKKVWAANCQLALFYYRAQITDYMTRDQNPQDISDMKVLTDKLFANFVTNPKSATAMANRIMDIEPNYYPAAQTLLFVHMMEAAEIAPGQPKHAVWQTVEADLERSRRIHPRDPQRAEIELYLLATRNESPEIVAAHAKRYAEVNPTSPSGSYYLAWSAYRSGKPNEGWQILNEANRKFPGDQRILGTLAGIKGNPKFYLSTDKSYSPFKANLTTTLDPSPDTD